MLDGYKSMTTKRDRAAAAAFFNDRPEWDLTIAHWIETGEKRYGMGTVRPNVLVLADAFAAHAIKADDDNVPEVI
jgi:hypothetical protein